MPQIKWSERLSVGVQVLDDQHKQLIEMINAIHDKSDAGAMFDIVMAMFNYAAVHFQTEEELLRSHRYPELNRQISEHKAFMAKTNDFASRDFGKPGACAQVSSYLQEWLLHHIQEEDAKYKACFSPHGR